jgi:hypothetical protein
LKERVKKEIGEKSSKGSRRVEQLDMERQLGNLKLDAGNRGEDAPQGSNDDSTKAAAISPPSNAPGMSSSTSSNGQHLALGAINAARRPTQPAVPPNMANMSPEVLARIAGVRCITFPCSTSNNAVCWTS